MDDLPADARELFDRHTTVLPAPEVAALRQEVRDHLEDFRAAVARNELLPLDLAEELADKLDALLRDYPSLAEEHARLAVGAARYFVSHDDASPDTSGVLGLDDDVAVFNHAVRQMDREDLVIDP